jgi:hypothetical protein
MFRTPCFNELSTLNVKPLLCENKSCELLYAGGWNPRILENVSS